MASDHIQALEENIAEVKRLLEIHKGLAGNTPGRKHNVEVLNKSAIVLLVACWEALIEDLAEAAYSALLAQAKDHTVFPFDVLTLASKPLKEDNDNRKVWDLAGEGWKKVLHDHKEAVFKQYIGKLNTPKPKQVDALFQALLGMPSISSNWHWKRMSAANAVKALEDLIELRGSIAHRVQGTKSVTKASVSRAMKLIYCLSVITSNRVRTFVYAKTKKRTWPSYKFGETK
jgi:hypothetical protein